MLLANFWKYEDVFLASSWTFNRDRRPGGVAMREVPPHLTQESIFIYLRPVRLIGFAQYWMLHMIETVSGFRLASVLFGYAMTWKAPPS